MKGEIDPALVRKILGTLKTFPTRKPAGFCIEELQDRGLSTRRPVFEEMLERSLWGAGADVAVVLHRLSPRRAAQA